MRSQSKKRPIKENRESSGIRIRQCTVYEPDFKKAVVLFAEQKGTSEAKKRYGISESNIRRWRKIENKRREISLGKSIPNMQHMVSKKLKKPSVCDDKLENDIANQLDLDSMPLNERLKTTHNELETVLHSQPLSPTKLKVTRQNKQSQLLGKSQQGPVPSAQPPPVPPVSIEEISLKWNSYQSNMQNMFPNLLSKEQYVDATLVADGRAIKCHRVILSSCSPYFEETLSNISPVQHPILFLKDVPFWVMKTLCDFMYTGEVKILQPQLEELLTAAENLKIKGLAGKSDCANDSTKQAILKSIKEEKTDDSKEKENKEKKKSTLDMPVLKNERLLSKITQNNEMPLLKRSKLIKFKNPLKKSDKPPKSFSKESVSEKDILDPFDLLEPVYEEVQKEIKSVLPVPKIKENKNLPVKKSLAKKVKKRKMTEERDESPPPIFLKKGTRSRPIRKMPKYYDDVDPETIPKERESLETTIVREPHTHQADPDPLLQPDDIKTEPLDLDENIIEIEDNVIEFNDDIALQEEDVIGDYDCSLISFERDKISTAKPPIKGVKIVDVTQIKNAEESQTDFLEEDPLNISQNSESTITITDVHSLIENKEDDNLDSVCNELGFRISEIHSQTSPGTCKEAVETEDGILGFQSLCSTENEEEQSSETVDNFKIRIACNKSEAQKIEAKSNNDNVECNSKNEEKLDEFSENGDTTENIMEVDRVPASDDSIETEINLHHTEEIAVASPKNLTESQRNNRCDFEISENMDISSKNAEEINNEKYNIHEHVIGQPANSTSNLEVDGLEVQEGIEKDSIATEEELISVLDKVEILSNFAHPEDGNYNADSQLEESDINSELESVENTNTFQYSDETVNNEECPFVNEVKSSCNSQNVLMSIGPQVGDIQSHSDDSQYEKEFESTMSKDDEISFKNSEINNKVAGNICSLENNVEAAEIKSVAENHVEYTKQGDFSQNLEASRFDKEPVLSGESSINEYGESSFKESENNSNTNDVSSIYKENEIEAIVNDLTKIVSESRSDLSTEDVQDDIEESLANLLK